MIISNSSKIRVLLGFVLAGILIIPHVFAGDLEPSAPPGPTMKTLDEVEPRIPIPGSDTPASTFNIKQSGSYYLTGSRLCSGTGIQVDADNVTIDLMGYSLIGPDSGLMHGISMTARNNIEVRNGTVRDFYNGVYENSTDGKSHRFVNLRAVSNINRGIYILGTGNLVKDCSASENGDTGIQTGHGSTVTGNTTWDNGSTGISAGYGCTVITNTAYENGDDGIHASNGSKVTGNTCRSNTGDGIEVTLRCRVTDNTSENNGAGIHLLYGYNHIKANTLIGSGTGLDIDGVGNYVADNIIKGNSDNYDIAEGNQLNILLCEIPETIDWPAMVTLAGTLTVTATDQHGITVDANDVTIDLGGHSLIGPGTGTNSGIYMSRRSNVEIINGTIREFDYAISDFHVSARGLRVIGVRAISNKSSGIHLQGKGHLVKDCTVSDSIGTGIFTGGTSNIVSNVVNDNGGSGISSGSGSTVTGNTAYNNIYDGISGQSGCTVTGNTVYYNQMTGIDVSISSTVVGNTVYSNNQSDIPDAGGIRVAHNCIVKGNTVTSNKQNNIYVYNYNNIIEENLVTQSTGGNGIYFRVSGSFYANNRASDNGTDYANTTGNTDGGGNVSF